MSNSPRSDDLGSAVGYVVAHRHSYAVVDYSSIDGMGLTLIRRGHFVFFDLPNSSLFSILHRFSWAPRFNATTHLRLVKVYSGTSYGYFVILYEYSPAHHHRKKKLGRSAITPAIPLI